jgi:hypothetical protein
MRNFLLFLILPVCLFLVISCNKEKLKSPAASFIYVGNPTVAPTYSQGTSNHKITETWIYVNGQYQGAFPLGGVIPIVATGNTDIVMYAGIKNNGIAATRIPYAMYTSYTFSQNFESGKTYTINPVYNYLSGATFHLVEGFENSGVLFSPHGDSSFALTNNPAKVFEGLKSLEMGMSDAKPTTGIKTSGHIYDFPQNSTTIYLEMNYKCNQKILVTMLAGDTEERSVITLNKTDGWNKIYISLSESVYTQPTYNYYDLIIKAVKEVSNPEIYIDNIKIISF